MMYTFSVLFIRTVCYWIYFFVQGCFEFTFFLFFNFSSNLLLFKPPALVCVLRGIAVPIRFTFLRDHVCILGHYLVVMHFLVYRTQFSPMRFIRPTSLLVVSHFLVYRTRCSALMSKSMFPFMVHNSRSGLFTCTCSGDVAFDIGRYNFVISLSPVYLCIYR